MTIQDQAKLSYYKPISTFENHSNVCIVQHIQTNQIFVQKNLKDYNPAVYEFLYHHPHPGIPKIYEMMEDEGQLIIIEEYISGRTLQSLYEQYADEKSSGQMSSQTFCFDLTNVKHMMIDFCEILTFLHGQNPPIIHRDLKPSNIIRDNNGTWKIIDFNTARGYEKNAPHDTFIMGTKDYAAPEQYGFMQSDERTDIYALGVIMNYLLTGKYPGEYIFPGEAEKIIRKCTQFDPAKRYQSVWELQKELEKVPDLRVVERKRTAMNRKVKKPNDEYREHLKSQKLWSWAPPGFRTKTWWKMAIAVLGYIAMFYLSLTLIVHNSDGSAATGFDLWCNRIAILMIFLLWTFFGADYRNIQARLPFVKRPEIGWKIFGYFFYLMIIFWVIVIILAILIS